MAKSLAKTKITINSGAMKRITKQLNSPKYARKIGKEVVKQMKHSISVGSSPVKGQKPFDSYSKMYEGRIKRGDFNKHKKKVTPINLSLSGKMLKALDFKTSRGKLTVGIFKDARNIKIAQGHQVGKGNLPKRRFIPSKNGEELNDSIMRHLKDLYVKIIREII